MWPPPKKSAWQIKPAKKEGDWLVRCTHGTEHVDDEKFAHVLWDVSQTRARRERGETDDVQQPQQPET